MESGYYLLLHLRVNSLVLGHIPGDDRQVFMLIKSTEGDARFAVRANPLFKRSVI